MKINESLELHDPETQIIVRKEHLDGINYLLESNVRHETTLSDIHHQHLQNAREVILMALRADAPNRPLTGLFKRETCAVPDEEC